MLLFRTVSVPSVTAVLALVADAADPLALLSTLLAELLLGGMVRRKELLLWVVVWLGGGWVVPLNAIHRGISRLVGLIFG